jgi:hypothetical protein
MRVYAMSRVLKKHLTLFASRAACSAKRQQLADAVKKCAPPTHAARLALSSVCLQTATDLAVCRVKKASGGSYSLAVTSQGMKYGTSCNYAQRRPADWPPHSTIITLFKKWGLINEGDTVDTKEDLMDICRRRPDFAQKVWAFPEHEQ